MPGFCGGLERALIHPVMPQGVEHVAVHTDSITSTRLIHPLMPQGVLPGPGAVRMRPPGLMLPSLECVRALLAP